MNSNEIYKRIEEQTAEIVNYVLVRDKDTGRIIGKISRNIEYDNNLYNSTYTNQITNQLGGVQLYYDRFCDYLSVLRNDIQYGFNTLNNTLNNLTGTLIDLFRQNNDYYLKLRKISYNLRYLSKDNKDDLKDIKNLKKELVNIIVEIQTDISLQLSTFSRTPYYYLLNEFNNLLFSLYIAYQELFHIFMLLKDDNNHFDYINKSIKDYKVFLWKFSNQLIHELNKKYKVYSPFPYFRDENTVNLFFTNQADPPIVNNIVSIINSAVNYIFGTNQQEKLLNENQSKFYIDVSGEAIDYINNENL